MANPPLSRWLGYSGAALLVAATVGALKLLPNLADATAALILLLAVFLSAWLWESGPGVLAALLATLSFNFFFLPPLHTFTIEDPRDIAAFVVFLASGLLIGRLSAVGRHRLRLVEAERRDLAALTQLSQAFLSDTNRESLLGIASDRLRQALVCQEVAILLAAGGDGLSVVAATPGVQVQQELAELAYRQRNSVALPSDLGGTDIYLPILVGLERVGALVARGLQTSERMAQGCAVLLGLALERERFVKLARAAEETKTSEEMKSTLLAALAHDLKTPVATARAALENWEADAGESDKSRLARDQLKALTRRIEDLMEVVRLDSGTARPRRERVSCGEIVEASISRFGQTLGSHSLSVDVPAQEIRIEVDPVQIAEALGHGLENAARYSPHGSEIRVSIEEEKDAVVLRVADSGKGIPPRDRDRVLERFVRLPNSEGVPGSGLGLSIARSLVELNGGRIRIGDSPGGGASFEIAFPKGNR